MREQNSRRFTAMALAVVLGSVVSRGIASSSPTEDPAPAPPKSTVPDAAQVAPPVARLDSAEIYYAWGDYAAVVRVLSRQSNSRPRANLLLGWSLYRLGRMPEAVTAFERGLELAPENLDLINGHAFALYRTDQPERAEAEFRRILATNPDREESIRGLAAVLYTSQRFAECLPIADGLLRSHPGDPEQAASAHKLGRRGLLEPRLHLPCEAGLPRCLAYPAENAALASAAVSNALNSAPTKPFTCFSHSAHVGKIPRRRPFQTT